MADEMFYEIVNGKRVARRRPSFPERPSPLPAGPHMVVNGRRVPMPGSNGPVPMRSAPMRPADSAMRVNGRWVRYNQPSAPPMPHPAVPARQARVGAAAGPALSYQQVADLVRLHNHSPFSDELVIAIIYKEPGLRPGSQNGISSSTGLMGITETARAELIRNHSPYASANFHDPIQNIDAATDYLRILYKQKHDTKKVFAVYGSGPNYYSEITKGERILKGRPVDPVAKLKSAMGDK